MRKPVILVALTLPLVACQNTGPVEGVERSWIRLPAVPGGPAAAYFTIRGGAENDRLLRVSSEVTTRTELHESMTMGGRMTMRPLDGVDVLAGSRVEFKPGGKHVMLYGMSSTIKPGQTVRLTFTMGDGDEYFADTPVQAASAPAKE